DAHGQTGLHGIVQEHGVDGLAHGLVATEREADVGDPARYARVRQALGNPARGFDEIHGVVIVFVNAGGDGKHVVVTNNIFRREADFVDQQVVRASANNLALFQIVGLPLFVKRHHYDGGAVFTAQPRVL